jgi:chorismate lyase/3-hydroxybenzoate synthase
VNAESSVVASKATAALSIDYVDPAQLPDLLKDPHVLAILGFQAGADTPPCEDPRYLQVGLAPVGPARLEVWRSAQPVQYGRDANGVAWASDGALMFGALQVDEADHGGIEPAAAHAYRELQQTLTAHPFPHLLRIWNYLDAIIEGDGDQERYRQFCVGRAQGLGTFDPGTLPAATAIGRVDGVRVLQVYWLAARQPGTPLENPRQVAAYRYPRQYGPQSPSFARAMLPAAEHQVPLLLSGTASVVGHQSLHAECTVRQLQETFANFEALLDTARRQQPGLPAAFGAHSPLKVYLRDLSETAAVEQALATHLDPAVPRIILHAQVCRHDLRVEIDGAFGN